MLFVCRILFLDKTVDDKRRIDNLDELLPAVRGALPVAVVDAQTLRELSAADQLKALSNVSIFVTTTGSPGFRLIFLPTGAQVRSSVTAKTTVTCSTAPPILTIDTATCHYNLALQVVLIGADENYQEGGEAFKEAIPCWQHLRYLNILYYHVSSGPTSLVHEAVTR